MTSFKFLGRLMKAVDVEWLEGAGNLRKDRKSWVRMMRILSREGADPKILGLFLKSAVQAVLLFGAETWVLTPWMKRSLSSFQHRFVQRLA